MGDPQFENGSGFAQAALYCMWLYQYGLYDSAAARQSAKEIAAGLLKTRFPAIPTHSNPKVQALITQLLS